MSAAEEQRIQRVVTLAVMAVAAVVGTALVTTGPDDPPVPSVEAAAAPTAAPTVAPGTTTTTTTPPESTTVGDGSGGSTTASSSAATTTTAGDDPGALPQTDERPSASGPTFTAGVDGLWEAVRQDRPDLGLPFFFPERAYLQVKAISDPAGDYQNRLVANFDEDVHSLHAQLGPDAANAKFVGISVPDDQAVWVQPGEESNQLSYWRVYGSTLQYQVDGQPGSFPVTSLISWRGQWYVVHLGAIR